MIITILVIFFNMFLLFFPQIVLSAAREGLLLWFNNVLPSLLPFIIATNMLVALGFVASAGKFLAPVMHFVFKLPGAAGFGLVTGLTSGYPMGAKTVGDLCRTNQLTPQQAQHLLAFSNNAGPLFILGVVGVGMFQCVRVGYILWAAHVLAALILGMLLRPGTVHKNSNYRGGVGDSPIIGGEVHQGLVQPKNPGKILGEAVKNAMESMTLIGGLIIFFSVVVAVIGELGLPVDSVWGSVLAGMIEVTGGVHKLSANGVSVVALGAAAFIVAFGGLSVHAQSLHFTAGTGIRALPYLLAKILHGIIAAGLTVILWSIGN